VRRFTESVGLIDRLAKGPAKPQECFRVPSLQDSDKVLDHGDEPVSDFGVAAQFKFGDIKEITNVTGLVRGHRDQ
jgi:hypothetical protein